jgi:hypothetical protein
MVLKQQSNGLNENVLLLLPPPPLLPLLMAMMMRMVNLSSQFVSLCLMQRD